MKNQTDKVAENNSHRRRSYDAKSLSRRGSIAGMMMPLMPTVHDDEEEEEEQSDPSSSTGSRRTHMFSDKGSTPQTPEEEGGDHHRSLLAELEEQAVASSQLLESVERLKGQQAQLGSNGTSSKSTESNSRANSDNIQESGDALDWSNMASQDESVSTLDHVHAPGGGDTAEFLPLSMVPFTRDIDVSSFSSPDTIKSLREKAERKEQSREGDPRGRSMSLSAELAQSRIQAGMIVDSTRRRTTCEFSVRTTAAPGGDDGRKSTGVWRMLPIPDPLSMAERGPGKRYPNTPLSIVWCQEYSDCFIFVGLLSFPCVLKVIPPKHHEPDKGGRFSVLPINSQRVLLADETSHQIWLINHQTKVRKHLAGCGKRGFVDGPLEICRMNAPSSMTLDPRSHYIYLADRGNHVIRKIDLLSGLMSTVVGNGSRGNSDGPNPLSQSLDSPFEVSFTEPHYLIISCADNSIRCFNLKTFYLETILIGT